MIGIYNTIKHLKLQVIIGIFRPFEKVILCYDHRTEKTLFDPTSH